METIFSVSIKEYFLKCSLGYNPHQNHLEGLEKKSIFLGPLSDFLDLNLLGWSTGVDV